MRPEQMSPTHLKSTQSILTSLYEKIVQPHSSKNHKQELEIRPYKLKDGIPASHIKINPCTETKALKTPQHQTVASKYESIDNLKDFHQHSDLCCINNEKIRNQLQKSRNCELMLQSYQEEVEYLKKVNMLQSEQIQKLRKILRIQQRNKHNQSCDYSEFVETEKLKTFMKPDHNPKSKRNNSLRHSTKITPSSAMYKNKKKHSQF